MYVRLIHQLVNGYLVANSVDVYMMSIVTAVTLGSHNFTGQHCLATANQMILVRTKAHGRVFAFFNNRSKSEDSTQVN